jgi:effector-binding domain-containing protein
MSGQIAIETVASRPFAAVHVTTSLAKWPSEFRTPLGSVYTALRTEGVPNLGQNIMVYRPREDGLVDIECGVAVAAKFGPIGDVHFAETPAGSVATLTHIGPYSQLGASHAAIAAWIRENGHRHTGICWEIYGHWVEDQAKLHTDLFHLLAK